MKKSAGSFIGIFLFMIIMLSLAGAQETQNNNYEVVIARKFYLAADFKAGLATVVISEPLHELLTKWSVINQKGELVSDDIGSRFEFSTFLGEYLEKQEGVLRFINGYEWVYVDRQGNIIKRIGRDADDKRLYAVVDMTEDERHLRRAMNSEKKWGYKDNERKTVIDFQFDSAQPFSEGLAAVKKDKLWGFINKEGSYVIEPQFEKAEDFIGGLARVQKNRLWGILNKEGRILIEPQFEKAEDFIGGLARVRKNKLWGLVNAEGVLVADCQYEEIGDFSEGMVPVKLNKKWGYVNQQGQLAIECQYQEVDRFSNGLAKARQKNWGIIDKSGKVIAPFEYPFLGDFYDGMIAFSYRTWGSPNKYGFLNDQGKVIVEPKFKAVTSYHQGLAEVMDDDDKLWLVDKEGKKILKNPCDFIGWTFDNLYWMDFSFSKPVNTDYGLFRFTIGEVTYTLAIFMDEYGLERFLENTSLDRIKRFQQLTGVTRDVFGPLIPVLPDNGKWGFMDRDGKIVIECTYDEVKPFCEGLAAVKMNDKWGYIDEKGEFAIPLQYANADSFSEGLAAVNMTSGFLKSKRYGFINKEGKLVIDYEFNSPRNFSEGLAYVHPIGYIHLKK